MKELPTPDFVGENELFRLSTLKGCLSLYGGKGNDIELDIWIMEYDGWKWLMKLSNSCDFVDTRLLCCIGYGKFISGQFEM